MSLATKLEYAINARENLRLALNEKNIIIPPDTPFGDYYVKFNNTFKFNPAEKEYFKMFGYERPIYPDFIYINVIGEVSYKDPERYSRKLFDSFKLSIDLYNKYNTTHDKNIFKEFYLDKCYFPNIDVSGVADLSRLCGYNNSNGYWLIIPKLETSSATNMSEMFRDCKIKTVPLLNTSNVTNMSGVFWGCDKLTNVPKFDTSKVTDMSGMFGGGMSSNYTYCESLTSVPLFDTSNVTNMSNMFWGCANLTSIPEFNTSKVTNMSGMMGRCKSLTSVPLFDTSNVTDMSAMFGAYDANTVSYKGCINLIEIPFFNTSKVTDMSNMLEDCIKITTIPKFDTGKVTNMESMFQGCINLINIPLLNTSNVTNMRGVFAYCEKLTSIPKLDFSSVIDITRFFGHSSINTLTDLGGFTDLKVDWNDDFGLAKCPNLTKQSIINVFNGLHDFRGSGEKEKILKINKKTFDLLSDEEKAIATRKGWVISVYTDPTTPDPDPNPNPTDPDSGGGDPTNPDIPNPDIGGGEW